MRSGYLTSVPWRPGLRQAFPSLSLRLKDASEVAAHAEELEWARMRRIELASLRDFDQAKPHQDRVRWRVAFDTEDFGDVLDLLGSVRSDRVALVVDIEDPALIRKTLFAVSLGVSVRVTVRPTGSEGVVAFNRLVSYFVLSPTSRRTLLEPLATLERELRGQRGAGLWAACEESVVDYLYCDEQGVLALSGRWAAAGRTYGHVEEEGSHGWERSPQFRALEDYRERLFRERSECAFCSAHAACQGWLRALDASYDCALWQVVLESFQEAVTMPPPRERSSRREGPPGPLGAVPR